MMCLEQCDFVLASVPQQENLVDCGAFALRYIEEFVQSPWQSVDLKVRRAIQMRANGMVVCATRS